MSHLQDVKEYKLFCPGPTPVSPRVLPALMRANFYHRDPDFAELFISVRRKLAAVMGAWKHEPLILTSSGTGAMEAAVVNLTQPQENYVVVVAGKFGRRWKEILQTYNCSVVEYIVQPDQEINAEKICEFILEQKPSAKAVFLQAHETSTGTVLPVQSLAQQLRSRNFQGLIVVDAISALLAHEVLLEEWDIDCVVGGSQKGFGIPPGLSFVALSERAVSQLSSRPVYYFNLKKELAVQCHGQTAFTPATQLIYALNAVLDFIATKPLKDWIAEHRMRALAVRSAMRAMNLELFNEHSLSHVLTAVKVPESIKASDIVTTLKSKHSIIISGGQDELKGKIVRLAHLGFVNYDDLMGLLGAWELVLHELGCDFELGAALTAAQSIFCSRQQNI